MKILFLTSSEEDYLADGVLIGLRAMFGGGCVDYPRKEILYLDCPTEARSRIRGGGFTLYTDGLPSIDVDRSHIEQKLQSRAFDLVIFSNIWRQFGLFSQWRPWLQRRSTLILDGEDTPQVYPYAGLWLRNARYWLMPSAAPFLYFKREWDGGYTQFNWHHRVLPLGLRRRLRPPANLRPIGFSVPDRKILSELPPKRKDFPQHIIDPELCRILPGASATPLFQSEAEYYLDLQASRFGITTRRAGWDCLRHYEIAANGAVPCFRNLDLKPNTCAPHGLVPGGNCIGYTHAHELLSMTSRLTTEEYTRLASNALLWARTNAARRVAERMISVWQESL